MNHKQLLKGILILAILICAQTRVWALNSKPAARAGQNVAGYIFANVMRPRQCVR
jgi:hypothetical protein